ncbi:MAG: hypothetical protein ACK5MA_04035 [Parachlamydiaceae bacterium]
MPDPIQPKTIFNAETTSLSPKKPSELHPLTELAAESLNIGSDISFDLDLDLDLSDLNIDVMPADDPVASAVNDVSMNALNMEISNIVTSDLLSFISSPIEAGMSKFDNFITKNAKPVLFNDVGKSVSISIADAVLIGSTLIMPKSKASQYHQNKDHIARQLNIPVHQLNLITVDDDQWSLFTAKLTDMTAELEKKINREQTKNEEVKDNVKQPKNSTQNRETNVFKTYHSSDVSGNITSVFKEKKRLQEEANAVEILNQERKEQREKLKREKQKRIDEEELTQNILDREVRDKVIRRSEIKKSQRR